MAGGRSCRDRYGYLKPHCSATVDHKLAPKARVGQTSHHPHRPWHPSQAPDRRLKSAKLAALEGPAGGRACPPEGHARRCRGSRSHPGISGRGHRKTRPEGLTRGPAPGSTPLVWVPHRGPSIVRWDAGRRARALRSATHSGCPPVHASDDACSGARPEAVADRRHAPNERGSAEAVDSS